MPKLVYDVIKSGGGWSVRYAGATDSTYETEKAAFEAAASAARNALRRGCGVVITAEENPEADAEPLTIATAH